MALPSRSIPFLTIPIHNFYNHLARVRIGIAKSIRGLDCLDSSSCGNWKLFHTSHWPTAFPKLIVTTYSECAALTDCTNNCSHVGISRRPMGKVVIGGAS